MMGGDIRGITPEIGFQPLTGSSTLQGSGNISEEKPIELNTSDSADISGSKAPQREERPQKIGTLNEVASTLGSVIGTLKEGENLHIKIDDQNNTIEAHKFMDKSNRWETFTKRVGQVTRAVREFTTDVLEAEPNFIFQQATSAAKQATENLSFMSTLPEATKNFINIGIYPGVRFVLTLLDAKKAYDTVTDKTASTSDKIINVGHVLTDIAGVVGGVAALAGFCVGGASALVATALVADVLALGYQGLRFIHKRAHMHQQDKPDGNNTGSTQNKPPANEQGTNPASPTNNGSTVTPPASGTMGPGLTVTGPDGAVLSQQYR